MASYQKPRVEKNHEYIRYVIPKGKSFNNRTQEDITLMLNHINSTARTSLNENTPFKLTKMLLDSSLLYNLSLKHIHADEVHLKPALFNKKYIKNLRQVSVELNQAKLKQSSVSFSFNNL